MSYFCIPLVDWIYDLKYHQESHFLHQKNYMILGKALSAIIKFTNLTSFRRLLNTNGDFRHS